MKDSHVKRDVCVGVLMAFLTVFSNTTFAQQVSNSPQETKIENEDFDLNTVLMESTFKIEGYTAQGLTLGTVFVIVLPIPNSVPPIGRYVMVTAAHVLEDMQGDTAVLHLRRKVDEKTNDWIQTPIQLEIRSKGQPLWKRHPDADVAAMYIPVPVDAPIKGVTPDLLADDKMLTEFDVKPGDELRCLGYPLGVASNEADFPVLRSGRIASYPLLPTKRTKTFLLDFRVFKGNSGGPVYYVERYRPNLKSFGQFINYHFIVGLVSQETLYTEKANGIYSQEVHATQLGLAKVVHASLIKETVEMLPPPRVN